MIVTDNGNNMLKDIRNLHDNTVDEVSDDNDDDDDDDTEADEVDVDEGDFPVPGVLMLAAVPPLTLLYTQPPTGCPFAEQG